MKANKENKEKKVTVSRIQFAKGRRAIQELNEQHAKKMWYLELTIAACLGASLALGLVVVHGMLTTNWTW